MSEQPYDRPTTDQIQGKEGAITHALRGLYTTVGSLEGEITELARRIDPILKPASEKLASPSQNDVPMPPKSSMEITVDDIRREVQAVGRRLAALIIRIDL